MRPPAAEAPCRGGDRGGRAVGCQRVRCFSGDTAQREHGLRAPVWKRRLVEYRKNRHAAFQTLTEQHGDVARAIEHRKRMHERRDPMPTFNPARPFSVMHSYSVDPRVCPPPPPAPWGGDVCVSFRFCRAVCSGQTMRQRAPRPVWCLEMGSLCSPIGKSSPMLILIFLPGRLWYW